MLKTIVCPECGNKYRFMDICTNFARGGGCPNCGYNDHMVVCESCGYSHEYLAICECGKEFLQSKSKPRLKCWECEPDEN